MLTDGESSRLQSAVVAKAGLATDIWASPGLLGGPLDARDPDVFVLGAIHPQDVPAAAVIDAAAEQIATLAADGPGEQEMQRALARFASALYRDNDGGRQPDPVARLAGAAARPGRAAQRAARTCCPRSPPTRSPTPPGRWIPVAAPCCASSGIPSPRRADGPPDAPRRSAAPRSGRGRCRR